MNWVGLAESLLAAAALLREQLARLIPHDLVRLAEQTAEHADADLAVELAALRIAALDRAAAQVTGSLLGARTCCRSQEEQTGPGRPTTHHSHALDWQTTWLSAAHGLREDSLPTCADAQKWPSRRRALTGPASA